MMLLEKWYLDAIFPDGTVWFGYHARLRLGCLPGIPWTSAQEVVPNGTERKVSRWSTLPGPHQETGLWQWSGPDNFQAQWEPTTPSFEATLFLDDQLKVWWNCVAPRAVVTRTNGGNTRGPEGQNAISRGVGYLEHLRIETTRADLPFRQLLWGRAHAGNSSLVWIRWAEGRDLSLLLEDGVQVKGRIQTLPSGGVRVQTERGEWETGTGRALCDRDVRHAFPRWLVGLTRGMAPTRELKMTGSARLRIASEELAGSGIWEEVQWR